MSNTVNPLPAVSVDLDTHVGRMLFQAAEAMAQGNVEIELRLRMAWGAAPALLAALKDLMADPLVRGLIEQKGHTGRFIGIVANARAAIAKAGG